MNQFDIAISVRDNKRVLLLATVVRAPASDVYVNFPRDYVGDWKPHVSQHASGQYHHKAFGKANLIQVRQKPDANMKGSMNVVMFGVAADEAKALNIEVDASKFHDAFEIPEAELSTDKYKTYIYVDLAQAKATSGLTFVGKLKRQQIFKDAEPWIVITLVET